MARFSILLNRGLRALRGHTLWLGFVSVLLPLLVLLSLQYRWLVRLERVSTIAHEAALHNYIEAVGTEVRYFYLSGAERVLNLPATVFTQSRQGEVVRLWSQKPFVGASRLFLMDYTRDAFGNLFVFDSDSARMQSPPASDESLAMVLACAPWQLMHLRDAPAESGTLRVDERDPDHRVILNAITDASSHVVGVAGMVLDRRYFETELLPSTIDRALAGLSSDPARGDLVVTLRDHQKNIVFTNGSGVVRSDEVTRNLPFVFADWTIGIHSGRLTPEQWARASFSFNVALSLLLALALTGGVVLALRAANRAIRLSEMKADFVSNVSHELRTPLASIRVFAEFLHLGRASTLDRVQEYGGYIEAESRRLSRLIDNILDFARIESGRKTYRFVNTDLGDVVRSLVASFEVRLTHEGYVLEVEEPPSPLPPVSMDPDAVAQAVGNLLDNAVKYSGESRCIFVRLFHDDGWIGVSVRDRGIGIERDEQRKIFERFHRVGAGLVHDVKGSGLGLSIVDHIVRAHHGRVTVESEPGRGSTFSIRLPVEIEVPELAAAALAAAADAAPAPAAEASPAPAAEASPAPGTDPKAVARPPRTEG